MNNLINYGQHFLVDKKVIRDFLQKCDLQSHESVLEIGPGQGVLTGELAQKAKSITAVEIDQRLKPKLDKLIKQFSNLSVIYQNALKLQNFDYDLVCGALSYAIFEPLVIKLIKNMQFARAVFLVSDKVRESQKEETGLLFYLLNAFFKIDFSQRVLPAAFTPKPRTAGVIIKLIPSIPKDKRFLLWRERFLKDKTVWQQNNASLSEFDRQILYT